MCNLIEHEPDVKGLLDINGAHVHIYGKAARAGRKLGHVTFVYPDMQSLQNAAEIHDRIIDLEPVRT